MPKYQQAHRAHSQTRLSKNREKQMFRSTLRGTGRNGQPGKTCRKGQSTRTESPWKKNIRFEMHCSAGRKREREKSCPIVKKQKKEYLDKPPTVPLLKSRSPFLTRNRRRQEEEPTVAEYICIRCGNVSIAQDNASLHPKCFCCSDDAEGLNELS